MNSNSPQVDQTETLIEIDQSYLDSINGGIAFGGSINLIGNPRPFLGFPQVPIRPDSVFTQDQFGNLLIDGQRQWYF